jgi:hypothetical protein
MAFCSAVTLCFASIFSLVAAALIAISFSTDNWQVVTVKRDLIKVNHLDFLQSFKSLKSTMYKVSAIL